MIVDGQVPVCDAHLPGLKNVRSAASKMKQSRGYKMQNFALLSGRDYRKALELRRTQKNLDVCWARPEVFKLWHEWKAAQ